MSMILSDGLLLTFVLKLSKYILLKHTTFKLIVRKKCLPSKEKQLVHDICSFCLIVAYRLKAVTLSISVERTSSLFLGLYFVVPYMKVRFLHNLPKLVPIYHLK